jgi:hypothetical protein
LFGLGEKKKAKTDHFGAPLAAAAGVLVAVGLVVLMVVEARPAGAAFPGQNGRITYAGYDGNDFEIWHEVKVDAGNGEILHHDLEDAPDESDAGERAGGF